jgi:hypothetical protein
LERAGAKPPAAHRRSSRGGRPHAEALWGSDDLPRVATAARPVSRPGFAQGRSWQPRIVGRVGAGGPMRRRCGGATTCLASRLPPGPYRDRVSRRARSRQPRMAGAASRVVDSLHPLCAAGGGHRRAELGYSATQLLSILPQTCILPALRVPAIPQSLGTQHPGSEAATALISIVPSGLTVVQERRRSFTVDPLLQSVGPSEMLHSSASASLATSSPVHFSLPAALLPLLARAHKEYNL